MASRKTIAIIGASQNAGAAIARVLVGGPYHLLLLSEEVGNLDGLYAHLAIEHPGNDAEVISCLVDASWEADIIILAVPPAVEQEVAGKIKEVASCKLVISIARQPELSDGVSSVFVKDAADDLQKLLPHSRVIKVFNMDPDTGHIDGKTISDFIEEKEQEQFVKPVHH